MIIKVTKAEAAERLGISTRTLDRRIRKGELQTQVGPIGICGKHQRLILLEVPDVPREVVPFPDTPLSPAPADAPAPVEPIADAATFVDSFGNKLGAPNPRYLAGFRNDPGSAFNKSNPANSGVHVRQVTAKHAIFSVDRYPSAQKGYGNLVDDPNWVKKIQSN